MLKLVPRLVSRFMGLQVGLYSSTRGSNFTMDALPHDLLYKFHHTEPFRKAISRSTGDTDTIEVDGNQYSLLYQNRNDKSRIYAYVFPKSKQASGAKDLIHTANLVPWNVILTNQSTVSELISEDDVSVFGKYVPAESMKSMMKSFQAYLCIFSDKSTGFLISERTDFIDGLTLEDKRAEYAIGQCIVNTIKFTTNLGVTALSKGHIIRKTLVYGIAANYYEQLGSVISFEINFDNGSSEILYSDERLLLHFPSKLISVNYQNIIC